MIYSTIATGGKACLPFLSHQIIQRRLDRAFALDRRADEELALGRHHIAERLAHAAHDLRAEAVA